MAINNINLCKRKKASFSNIILIWMMFLCSSFKKNSSSLSSSSISMVYASSASSTLLKMHKLYTTYPPHETSLYDTLGVKPNATMAEITKAYHRKTRDLHPDKQRRQQNQNKYEDDHENASTENDMSNSENDYKKKLDKVREAYEVLKADVTRLPYHKFGLVDTGLAAMLLSGGKTTPDTIPNSSSSSSSNSIPIDRSSSLNTDDDTIGSSSSSSDIRKMSHEQRLLLQWMGFSPNIETHEQRVSFITTNLVEILRPLVENLISQEQLAHEITMQCDALKSLPLGSQIIRCIGRAYRHSGQAYLSKYYSSSSPSTKKHNIMNIYINSKNIKKDALGLKQKWRKGKDLMTAAVATGKLFYIEQKEKSRIQKRKKDKTRSNEKMIDYHNMNDDAFDTDEETMFSDTEDESVLLTSEDEIRESERSKAQIALIHTLQIEALWKVSKIDLDKTIQESCKLLLSGNHFFFPSHYGRYGRRITGGTGKTNQYYNSGKHFEAKGNGQYLYNNEMPADGWVGGSGQIVDMNEGRMRAAAALVLIGDTLVQCSKDGTSWVE